MFIAHIALQGCLRWSDVKYGLTADTGGHIRYLIELVKTSAARADINRIDILTRGFDAPSLGEIYLPGTEMIDDKIRIVRLPSANLAYLPKEELYGEADALAAAAEKWLGGLGCKPDCIHAHYADAGLLAARIKRRHGIPFVFTGHSLGRVKANATGLDLAQDEFLCRRIATEEEALAAADAVVTSSRDEAEAQYAGYREADSGRLRVIPPGSDLTAFANALASDRVKSEVDRFLCDPHKPMVLAIARPVRKKNLSALVHAFGTDTKLRESANLVIVAGCRGHIDDLEQECADVMREVIDLVDSYDLYGHVAYPKAHRPEDIPAYYALARDRRGVFVNPALHEPFGLTLLEAAATGLPVVATDNGGPNDIVERCENGILINPSKIDDIAQACLALLENTTRWDICSDNGLRGVTAYDWRAHVDVYHALLREITQSEDLPTESGDIMLVCDIDNTLLGNKEGVRRFAQWRRGQAGLVLGIASGRSFHSAQAILAADGISTPAFIVSSVGTVIHCYNGRKRRFVCDTQWERLIDRDWERERLLAAIRPLGLRIQGPLEQLTHKLSYFIDTKADAGKVRAAIAKAGLCANVVVSHGRYLDILPSAASKGAAIDYLRRRLGIEHDEVIVAGDSGNDVSMLAWSLKPIIVANHRDRIVDLPELSHSYVARAGHAAGVIEGVEYFRKAQRP